MKLIILLLAISGAAHATEVPREHNPHRPATPTRAQATQTQTQQATSAANAAGGSASATGGAGGNAGAGGAGGMGGSVGDASTTLTGDSSDYNAWSIVLPPLAFTPPMAAIQGCAPQITQASVGFLFGAFSQASGTTDVSSCTLMALRNVKVDTCQYGAAQQIEDLLTKRLLPDYVPGDVKFPDLTPTQCAALKTPPPAPVLVNYVAPPVPVSVPEPVKKPKPKKKPCPTGQKLVCTKE